LTHTEDMLPAQVKCHDFCIVPIMTFIWFTFYDVLSRVPTRQMQAAGLQLVTTVFRWL